MLERPPGSRAFRPFTERFSFEGFAALRDETSKETSMTDWEPKITAFFCNWCTYGAADLAGVSRLQYPPNIRVIRVPCSGRISPKFLLAAFRHGADGVWVSG